MKEDKRRHQPDVVKTRSLAEDQPPAETPGIPSEKQVVQSSVTGDSASPAGDRAAQSQSSCEGISALSSQSPTPRCSLDKDVETETDHLSLLDKLFGTGKGAAGDRGNVPRGCDQSRQSSIRSQKAASASVSHGLDSPPPGPPASSG